MDLDSGVSELKILNGAGACARSSGNVDSGYDTFAWTRDAIFVKTLAGDDVCDGEPMRKELQFSVYKLEACGCWQKTPGQHFGGL